MNAENFCYWLQGHFELTDSKNGLSAEQVEMIKSHLDLVFVKVTPPLSHPYRSIGGYTRGVVKRGIDFAPTSYC